MSNCCVSSYLITESVWLMGVMPRRLSISAFGPMRLTRFVDDDSCWFVVLVAVVALDVAGDDEAAVFFLLKLIKYLQQCDIVRFSDW